MKKIISVLTAVIFFTVSFMVYAGDDSWKDSGDESGEKIGLMLVLSAVIVGLVAVGITLTLKKSSKNDAAIIFNEATSSHGERSNLEILAKLYEISVDEVINTISTMVVNGEIDMAAALADDEAAWEALARLNQALEAYSQGNGENHQGRLEKFREKFKTVFSNLTERPTTLELASFYRGFFKEINTAAE
jgi:NADH:ubiquinone oxidoreductase subunit 5 (subunit L)/multisubunit Na+/H+ antiporter MnhA subunit